VLIRLGGYNLKQQAALRGRQVLKAKMASIFGEKINALSTELQRILLDDMVTAFENRLNVLNRITQKSRN
jgi:hypothetical protein